MTGPWPSYLGTVLTAWALHGLVPVAHADTASASPLDEVWRRATLYENADNPILQRLKLRGRYHGQFHLSENLQEDLPRDDGWEDRRIRLGLDATLFHKTVNLRVEAIGGDSLSPAYDGLNDLTLTWKPHSEFSLRVGKQKPQFAAYDRLQSSNTHPAIERSHIYTQLPVDSTLGLVAEGEHAAWTWQAGLYSNSANDELGSLSGGYTVGAGLGHHWRDCAGLDSATWRLDFLHGEIQEEDTVLNHSPNALSTTIELQSGPLHIATELLLGLGEVDRFGFYILPTYTVIPERLQIVMRYSYSAADSADGLRGASRYERPVINPARATGERHHAVYLGGQWFLHGDGLKFMAGAEWANLRGPSSASETLTLLTGIRFSF